jgi:hypothetical protein
VRVLEQAKSKIERYDEFDKERTGGKYNKAYRDLLRARADNLSLVEESGRIGDASLNVVENTLIEFEMKKHCQMHDQFKERLKRKLEPEETRIVLRDLRPLAILSPNLQTIKVKARHLFERLGERKDGLDGRGYRFRVGAAKTMNFLYPELFVLMDSFVLAGLGLKAIPDFQNYWSILTTCRNELQEWQRAHGGLDDLTRLDQTPTTLTRIFDKCAFIMGLEKRQ